MLTLLAFGATSLLSAQSNTVAPSPNWRLGDRRQMDVQVETKVTMDTLVLNAKAASTYYLEVIRARKDGYELKVRSGAMDMPTTDMNLGTEFSGFMDSVNKVVGTLVTAVYEPFSNWEVHYHLDRSGKVLGRIEGKDDKEKLTTAMQQAIKNAAATLSRTTGDAPMEISEERVRHFVDSLYDAFLQVQENEMSYFLKIYGTTFPLTGSLRQPVMVEDVQAPLHADMPTLPAIMEVGLDKNDDTELVGRSITTYDADALFEAMKDSTGSMQRKGLFMDEECVEHFDKRTGWLTESNAVIRLRSSIFRMDVKIKTQLKIID